MLLLECGMSCFVISRNVTVCLNLRKHLYILVLICFCNSHSVHRPCAIFFARATILMYTAAICVFICAYLWLPHRHTYCFPLYLSWRGYWWYRSQINSTRNKNLLFEQWFWTTVPDLDRVSDLEIFLDRLCLISCTSTVGWIAAHYFVSTTSIGPYANYIRAR